MLDLRFKDVKVRQAFNYAIDKDQIGTEILRNQFSELGYFGIVPHCEEERRGGTTDKGAPLALGGSKEP